MIKVWQYLLSILVTFVIAFYLGRASENVTYIDNTMRSDTTVRITEHTREFFYHDTRYDTVYVDSTRFPTVDTAEILKQFFTQHVIVDSIDTMEVRAKIRSTLYGNEIVSNVWSIQNYRKTSVTAQHPSLFVGMVYDQTLQPAVMYMPKRIGYYGQLDWSSKTVKAGLFYRIK
jgi:hypothetical protein